MPTLRLGDRVFHPHFGAGTLLRLLSGDRARIRFDLMRLLPLTVEVGALTRKAEPTGARRATSAPEKTATPAPVPTPSPRAAKQSTVPAGRARTDPETAAVRQALEALRLGVVPSRHVQDYTVGRSSEIESVESLLETGRGLRVVWGDYGAGKTHILDVAETLGLRSGYVTARVVLNPVEVPPTHPLQLYRAFVRNMRYPDDTEVGWRPLLARLETSPAHVDPDGKQSSRFFSPVLFALRSGDEEAIDWAADYIEGYRMDSDAVTQALRKVGWRGPRLLRLSDYRTYGRVYVHMMGTLACWARDAGYAGLLLLMDEVEYIDAFNLQNFRLAREVLMHYAAATLPRSSLGFDPAQLYRGGHAVHRALDLRFRARQPLAAMMAFTPLGLIMSFARQFVKDEETSIWLKTLEPDDLRVLVGKIVDLYHWGYPPFRPKRTQVERLRRRILQTALTGDDSPREIVRTTVSVLDCLRYGRDPFDGRSADW